MKKKLLTLMLSLVLATAPTMTVLAEEVITTTPTESVDEVTETTDEITEDATNQQVQQDAVEEAKDALADVAEGVTVETDDQTADEKQSELDELKKKTEDELLEEEAEEETEDEESEETEEDELVFGDAMSQDAMNAGTSGNFSSLGSSVTWSVSGTTLTIGGSGAMPAHNNGDGNWTAFLSACSGITKIQISSGVTSISAYAFSATEYSAAFGNVSSVSLPSSVTDIGAFAFKGMTKLTSIEIPCKNVHEAAFINCSNLQTITLGAGVKEVGISAFEGCTKISRVNASSIANWCGIYFGGIKSNPTEVSGNLYVSGSPVTNLIIPSGVTEIPDFAFQGVKTITQVTFPSSVKTIGEYAFHGCSGIQFVKFNGSGIKTIGAYAFEAMGNKGFIDLSLPSSIEYIGEYAFANNQLQTINIQTGHIADYAFRHNALMFAILGPKVEVAPRAFDGVNTEVLRHDLSANSYNVPNTVGFGSYKGATIQWKILTVSNGKALLLSEQVLDYKQFYNTDNQTGKWANSDIRTWLNGTFYSQAFSSSQQGKIQSTIVSDSSNTKYGTAIGSSTTDKVFLLSEQELTTYLPKADLRVAPASSYCQGANSNPARYNTSRVDKSAYYWLRTPGIAPEYSEFVGYNGTISYDGAYTGNPEIYGVRPAIWVDASIVSGVSATKKVTFSGITSTNWKRDVYAFVERLYRLTLGRTPDAAGWQDWEQQLEQGRSNGAWVARGFFLSPEMINRKLSNDQYVEILYNVMMNRGSDPVGKADWVNALESGVTYEGIVKGFAESNEFTQICESYGINRGSIPVSNPLDVNRGVTKFVARCYTKTLGRKYDPEGLVNWVNHINSNPNPRQCAIQVSIDFIHSQEFQNKNLSHEAFVDVLYRTYLGREADPVGRADWVNQLKSGRSRDDIMSGFYNSQEFNDIMSSYGL